MSSLKQGLHQKLLQKLSPQQIQLMKLLQIPVANLEQRIKEELQENPALEEGQEHDEDEYRADTEGEAEDDNNDDEELSEREEDISLDEYLVDDEIPDYKTSANNTSPDEERREVPIGMQQNFQEQLLSQLYTLELDDKEYHIAEQLIGSLDDDGYLRRELSAIVDDLAFSQNIMTTPEELESVLRSIQNLDPPGIGARSLQECLLLQLERKPGKRESVQTAWAILNDHFEEFSKKHYEKIQRELQLTPEQLKAGVGEILKLNPRPGNTASQGQRSTEHIIPDFLIANNDGVLELTLNSRNAPELKISREYREMLDHYSKDKKNVKANKDAITFVKQKLDAAKWFIDALRQRQHTLLETMRAIMEYQYEYFQEGDPRKLKKMVLRDIAEKVNMDISTVSRVANSKYVQTHFGTYLLKSFFSEGLQTESGEEVSSKEVKQILLDCIGAEDKLHPLTDDALTKILNDKGYNIARRTVAKYREMLDIPVARLRKEL
ncbi:MAG: RNA polymerase factor sigma-54 [Bacteroidota bacterium]|jgi:RNA polymerase sigma-54 factor|uniref:RNA polymerase factor sigma-54 n=1 Tax=Candidatus Pollutiaquabacter sp. TaxID=3416354 RepID=UPI001A4AEF8C|nr:RNA polymerase factor sigma-54 [Bacteroidota bacterium]MBL7947812.1 RNA polymerase factor sigma-54 [Bacteroidia bacterium]MBP7436177.1 RNA polymerase factor sigma-54 [Bacteroidia bacterium]MBP7728118.1 RNA polymerase factor sigma-54 [Bacteroidia bacterium]MBP7771299.1 RNA polymerase factor sigma-54 [Bacteroidia bacterium]